MPIERLDIEIYRNSLVKTGFTVKNCDYAYANLYAWREKYNTEFAVIHDGFVFKLSEKQSGYPDKTLYMCPTASKELLSDCLHDICTAEKNSGSDKTEFFCVPDGYISVFAELFPNAVIKEDRAHFDYIYKKSSLISYSGKDLHSKRNHRNKFFSLYGYNYEFKAITKENVKLCYDFNEKWYEINPQNDAYAEERVATEQLLSNFDKLKLTGGMIFVGSNLCAYTIASDIFDGSDTIIIHAEKGLYDIEGVYPTICSEFLKNSSEHYRYVNREDDVGDEGLRKSKMSYRPAYLEKKYSVTINFK